MLFQGWGLSSSRIHASREVVVAAVIFGIIVDLRHSKSQI